jgi:shikimate kinase
MTDNQYRKNKNNLIIFLVGFMGCGKTSIGKKLAAKIGYELIDTDKEIERIEGQKVKDIFEKHGEKTFRLLESKFIESIKEYKNVVISTGGGLPCHNDLIDKLLNYGTVIYLDVSVSILSERLKNDTNRPLIQNLNNKELISFVTNKLNERIDIYNKASIKIDANKPINEIIQQIQWMLT